MSRYGEADTIADITATFEQDGREVRRELSRTTLTRSRFWLTFASLCQDYRRGAWSPPYWRLHRWRWYAQRWHLHCSFNLNAAAAGVFTAAVDDQSRSYSEQLASSENSV